MRELTAVIWSLVITYICRTELTAASRSGDATVAAGAAVYSPGSRLVTRGSKQAESGGTWRSGISRESTRDGVKYLNVPRNPSELPGAREDGYTSLFEEDYDPLTTDSGYSSSQKDTTSAESSPSSSSSRRSSLSANYSSSEESGSGVSFSFSDSVLSVIQDPTWVSSQDRQAGTDSSARGTPAITISPADNLSWSERLLQDAAAFVARAAAATATNGMHATQQGEEGLVNYTFVDPRLCKVALLLGAAKAARDVGGVSRILEVKVNNKSNIVNVVYEERSSIHDKNLLKRSVAIIRKAFGVVKKKVRSVDIAFPEGCFADQSSRYYIFLKEKCRLSDSSLVESVVVNLNYKPQAFRVPRILKTDGWTENQLSPPNDWIRRECSWSLAFSRYLSFPPILKIDRITGRADFDNKELRDLSVSLADKNRDDDRASCNWSSPFFSKLYVSGDLEKNPPEWKVKLVLNSSIEAHSFVHHVKLGNGEDVGIPAHVSGSGLSTPRSGLKRSLVE